jgi:hypothetical protein
MPRVIFIALLFLQVCAPPAYCGEGNESAAVAIPSNWKSGTALYRALGSGALQGIIEVGKMGASPETALVVGGAAAAYGGYLYYKQLPVSYWVGNRRLFSAGPPIPGREAPYPVQVAKRGLVLASYLGLIFAINQAAGLHAGASGWKLGTKFVISLGVGLAGLPWETVARRRLQEALGGTTDLVRRAMHERAFYVSMAGLTTINAIGAGLSFADGDAGPKLGAAVLTTGLLAASWRPASRATRRVICGFRSLGGR